MVGVLYACNSYDMIYQSEIDKGDKPWETARGQYDEFKYCPYCGIKLERPE